MTECVLPSLDPSAFHATAAGTWIYFLQEGSAGPIKIGYAWRVLDRLRSAQTGNPRELRLIGVIFVLELGHISSSLLPTNARRVERELHLLFAPSRIRGEWFSPSEDLVRYVANLRTPEGTP